MDKMEELNGQVNRTEKQLSVEKRDSQDARSGKRLKHRLLGRDVDDTQCIQ